MASKSVLTISQLTAYIKTTLEGDLKLKSVFVSGEISGCKIYPSSGHIYFSLKDDKTKINCVMYANSAALLRFAPNDGMKVLAMGRISVYAQRGEYQFCVESMQPDGVGELAVAYEQLKNRLSSEGVFDEKHKRPIPEFPRKIGVVTSSSGAVIQDIKNVVSRRCPLAEIILYPSAVQGAEAPVQLIRGLKYFNSKSDIDVIIIGRGGGSLEELNCFNDENLVWTIYDSHIPIISAVGHETDFTLCDFVSDLRVPTPSAAAELAVPDKSTMIKNIEQILDKMYCTINEKIQTAYQDVDRLNDTIEKNCPSKYLESEIQFIDNITQKIKNSVNNKLILEQANLNILADSINARNPIYILQKGYSFTEKNGKCVSSVKSLQTGDKINIRLSDGTIECSVVSINKKEED